MVIFAGNFKGSSIIFLIISSSFLASKGETPKSISNKITPKAQISILVEELKESPDAS